MATRKVINKIIKDGQAYYIFGSGGADIEVDSALSTTSENPVQNKVITTELNKKANSNSLGTAASKDTGTSAGNVPLLNSNGKLDDSIIPAVAIVDTYAVTNKSDLLALSAQKGDVGIVSSESKSYILGGTGDPTVEANWLWLKTPSAVNDATISLTQAGDAIDSFTVNQATNKTIALRGDIYLTQDEYDALPSSKETDGNNYHIIDASGTSKRLYSVGDTAPENPVQGDLWYDTTEDKFKSYNGTEWEEIGGGSQGYKSGNIDILVIGGGGGGGVGCGGCPGGGGGGGGYRYCQRCLIDNETTHYCVVVGAGGTGGTTSACAGKGGASRFGDFIACGGGGGGSDYRGGYMDGASGGGGASGYTNCYPGGNGISGQGNNGGRFCFLDGGSCMGLTSGGGGGAASVGAAGTWEDGKNCVRGGTGGNGCLNDISGESVYYSGGGGGTGLSWRSCTLGLPGLGGCGGGNGGVWRTGCCVEPTTPDCYGGGGGGNANNCPGANGQQGVVYVRYKTDGSCGIKPKSTGGCKYTCGEWTIHRFDNTLGAEDFIPAF